LLPGSDRDLRIIRRISNGVAYYEIFARGVAIATATSRRRPQNTQNLTGIGLAALESGGRVGVSLARAPDALARAPDEFVRPGAEPRIPVSEVLERFAKGDFGWYELELGMVHFALHGVEMRFWVPQEVSGVATPARGFFADLVVHAHTCEEMRVCVEQFAAEHQASTVEIPAPEVFGTTGVTESRCEQIGGRIYYP
jgi:hypothetical protein